MSGQSPWSVKGVEPKTREAAKDLARREDRVPQRGVTALP